MMINKRLINMVEDSKNHIKMNIVYQWLSLVSNVVIIVSFSLLLEKLFMEQLTTENSMLYVALIVIGIIVRYICTMKATKASYFASDKVKLTLRSKLYSKLLDLGPAYVEKVSTAEVIQVASEGVDQLEIYFGKYIPQFFYSLLAPLSLFVFISFISFKAAIVLLICVPLIPMSIVMVQKFAKKILNKYWDKYTSMGSSFLENLQGLTTLKIYQSDQYKHEKMNEEAEEFRKVTMKVLTMQLNSITLMDLIAYGGAAIGLIVAIGEMRAGNISLAGCFIITLLAADFFIPLRLLGSFFHIAMNGMAATDKMFKILDLEAAENKQKVEFDSSMKVTIDHLSFAYKEDIPVLKDISLTINKGQFVSIVGKSGCGKSTLAKLLNGRLGTYQGSMTLGNHEIQKLDTKQLMDTMVTVSHNDYIFKGTVRENLLLSNPNVTEQQMWQVLEEVNLRKFMESQNGLDTKLVEQGNNFSGGQKQRLVIARALLKDASIYIFDEATSNIDAESEQDIMEAIYTLAKTKTVILISHRLLNVVPSDVIVVMEDGVIVEQGKHQELLDKPNTYAELFQSQMALEQYSKGELVYETK